MIMQENNGRPLIITLIFIFHLIAIPFLILGLFNPKVMAIVQPKFGDYLIPGIILEAVLFTSVIGIFLMKKWGFYLYVFTATIGILMSIVLDIFKPVNLIGPLLIIILTLVYYKRLT